jgi:hypothetical protein
MYFLVSVHANRHYKQLIFCVILIVSFRAVDTINRLPADAINGFCSSASHGESHNSKCQSLLSHKDMMRRIRCEVLIIWSEKPLSLAQGRYAQIKDHVDNLKKCLIENVQNGESSLRLKCEYCDYLFLAYMFVILLRGMQHVFLTKTKWSKF